MVHSFRIISSHVMDCALTAPSPSPPVGLSQSSLISQTMLLLFLKIYPIIPNYSH